MKAVLDALKLIVGGAHNIPKILFGDKRITSKQMKADILGGRISHYETVDKDLCIGCGICSKVCPTKAITMVPYGQKVQLAENRFKENVPQIDHEKCVYCMHCHDFCQVYLTFKKYSAIHPREVKITGVKAQDLFKKKEEEKDAEK